MDCPVCLDKFTTSVRKPVQCPYCNESCCVKCIQRYLLESAKDPCCLHCSKSWNRSFLQENLSKAFIDHDYAKRRAEILWSKEESFIPAAQEKAINIKKSIEYEKINILPMKDLCVDLIQKKLQLEKEIRVLQTEIFYRGQIYLDIKDGIVRDTEGKKKETEEDKEKNKFKRKCTVADCPGWLSSAWKCGLCENFTCPDCYIVKGKTRDDKENPHVCKNEDIETVKMLKSSTKPCPKCGMAIEKGEGCNVMFCTDCHTGFDWVSGKILEAARIHNPHFFEWQQRNNTANELNPEDMCGRRLNGNVINRVAVAKRQTFGKMVRIIMHVQDIECSRYEYHITHQNNEDLLIEYLVKTKTKEEIKRSIQNRERRVEREKAIRDILDTFIQIGSERVISVVGNPENVDKVMEDLEKLKSFINESLERVGKMYGCKTPYIEEWEKVISKDVSRKSRKEGSVRTTDSASVIDQIPDSDDD